MGPSSFSPKAVSSSVPLRDAGSYQGDILNVWSHRPRMSMLTSEPTCCLQVSGVQEPPPSHAVASRFTLRPQDGRLCAL